MGRRALFSSRRVLSLALVLAVAATGVAQSPRQQQPRFRITSNLVLIDVRVTDRAGGPIRGLTADDFTVFEGGVQRPISYFEEVWLPLADGASRAVAGEESASGSASSPPLTAPPRPAAADEQRLATKRLLILLFNLAAAGVQDVQMMRESAQRFLENDLDRHDAVAVVVFDQGLELVTDFTSDREEIAAALGAVDTADPDLDTSLVDEDVDPDESGAEFVADEAEFALFQTNQQLSAIQSIADAFRDVPGRKALLYFTPGLRSRGVESDEQMRWTTDMSNRANMSIYPVDSRGLVALSPGGGASRAGGSGRNLFSGRAALNELAGLVESQDGLITLADNTGGKVLIDDNDLGKIFREAREDASHYYLIGYNVDVPPTDGRFRKIEVRTSADDATLTFREGYYADKPWRSLSRTEREFQLLQAVVDDLPVADLPLALGLEYFPTAEGPYQVPVLLRFDYAELARLSGAEELNLEIVLLARDEGGVSRDGIRDQLEIRRREKDAEAAVVYQNQLYLEPGVYEVAAFVRDNRTGKLTRSAAPLTLPPDGRVSSLVIAGGFQPPEAANRYRVKTGEEAVLLDNPLHVGARVLIPRVGQVLTTAETLFLHAALQLEIDSKAPWYRIELSDAGGDVVFSGSARTMAAGEGGRFTASARVPLDQLEPGRYEVAVIVEGAGNVELRRRFEVVEP